MQQAYQSIVLISKLQVHDPARDNANATDAPNNIIISARPLSYCILVHMSGLKGGWLIGCIYIR